MSQKQVRMIANNAFGSTVWGNVDEGGSFMVAPGYVADLERSGTANRAALTKEEKAEAKAAEKAAADEAKAAEKAAADEAKKQDAIDKLKVTDQ